jgi:uncharacterized membrane protein
MPGITSSSIAPLRADRGLTGAARALGCFAIALGAAQLLVPDRVAKVIGVPRNRWLLRLLGARELASGLGLLSRRGPAGWLWARVAGDALDLALLGAALAGRGLRARTVAATAAVAGVTALDLFACRQVTRRPATTSQQRTLTIGASADQLYRSWRDPATLARLMEPFAQVTTSDGRVRWSLALPRSGRRPVEWQTEVVEDSPGTVVRWREPGAQGLPRNEGAISFRPAPANRGTEVTLQLALAQAWAPDLALKVALEKVLRRFKSLVETGEIPTVDRNPSARAARS